MARKTVYCVQTLWCVDGRLQGGPVQQFMRLEDALAAGQARAGEGDGLAVYELSGEPAADHWDEATVLATYGQAPAA